MDLALNAAYFQPGRRSRQQLPPGRPLEETMQLPFMIFGIDKRATAVTTAMIQKWPHKDHPLQVATVHLFFDMLDQREMHYVCRMLGMMALRMLRFGRENIMDQYDIFLPAPVGDERFNKDTIDSNVERLVIDNAIRPRQVAVGVSGSGLMLASSQRPT
jgi:hypothetical protein